MLLSDGFQSSENNDALVEIVEPVYWQDRGPDQPDQLHFAELSRV